MARRKQSDAMPSAVRRLLPCLPRVINYYKIEEDKVERILWVLSGDGWENRPLAAGEFLAAPAAGKQNRVRVYVACHASPQFGLCVSGSGGLLFCNVH